MAYNPIDPNGQATMANSAPVVVASDQSTIPVSASGGTIATVSNLAQFPTDVALADATANPTLTEIANFPFFFNGASWDRQRSLTNYNSGLSGVSGLGAAMAGILGQYNSTPPNAVSGLYYIPQLTAKAQLQSVLYDAAGNNRGANVNSSNQLSVSLDGITAVGPLPVSQSGVWNVGLNNSTITLNVTVANVVPVSMTTLSSVVTVVDIENVQQLGGVTPTFTGSNLNIQLQNASIPVTQSGFWNSNASLPQFPANANLADGTVNPNTTLVGSLSELFNGATWDRQRSLTNYNSGLSGVSGLGAAMAGILGQYNSTMPNAVSGLYYIPQLTSKAQMQSVIFDAAGNNRGANVNASNELSVSVDNTPNVTQSGVWNVGLNNSTITLNVNVTDSVAVTGTFWQSIQPVSQSGNWGVTASIATLSTVVNVAQLGGTAPTFTSGNLNTNITNASIPVTQSGFWSSNASLPQFPVNAALADGTANPNTTLVGSMSELFNGATWDRQRSLTNYNSGLSGVSGIGAAMSGILGQYNSTMPNAVSGLYYIPQLTSKAQMQSVLFDAAGNARGANVNASNQLSVSVDNTPAVTQSGTWNIGSVVSLVQFATNAALADATANPTTTLVGADMEVYNGATWDRIRSVGTAQNTLGTGIPANGIFGQYVPSYTSLASGAYGILQIDTQGRLVTAPTGGGSNVNVTQFGGSNVTNVLPGVPLIAISDSSGNKLNSTSNALNVSVQNASIPVTQSGFWNSNASLPQFPVNANLGDGTSNPNTTLVGSMLEGYNGASWDRIHTLSNYPSGVGSGVSGIGSFMAGILGQYNSTLPTATSGLFYIPQLTSKAQMQSVLFDAAGNNRGVNVNSNNQLSISVDNVVGTAAIGVSLATLSTVVNVAQLGGTAPTFTSSNLNVQIANASIPVTQSGFWSSNASLPQFPVNAALADGTANPNTTLVGSMSELWNGVTWDRARSLTNYGSGLSGVSGIGVQMAGMLGQYNATLPTAGSGIYYVPQLTSKAQLQSVLFDAAGNNRGANVNASNQLSISLDGLTTASALAVSQSGYWQSTASLPQYPAAAALADGTANPTTTLGGAMNELYNGSTWDRMRSLGYSSGASLGTGILGAGMLGQYSGLQPASLASNALYIAQLDQAGNLRSMPGMSSTFLAYWSASTPSLASLTIYNNSGAPSTIFQIDQTTTVTAGAITFAVTYDGSNWVTPPASTILDPTSTSWNQITIPYTLQASTNKPFLIASNGWQALSVQLSTKMTGTATLSMYYSLLPVDPAEAVLAYAATPTAATVPNNAFFMGGRSQVTEATAAANNQLSAVAMDIVGKPIVMPFANKELFVSGLANTSTTNSTQVIPAQAGSYKFYMTGFSIANTGATNTLVTFQNGSGTSLPIWTTIAPTVGGSNFEFLTPVATSAAKGLFFQLGSSSASVYVAVTGYAGT